MKKRVWDLIKQIDHIRMCMYVHIHVSMYIESMYNTFNEIITCTYTLVWTMACGCALIRNPCGKSLHEILHGALTVRLLVMVRHLN